MIVSFSGLIGSGKDTAAKYLIDNYGFTKMSFSGSLKDAVAAILGWDRNLLEGETPESRAWREQIDEWWSNELGREVTPRWALQYIGTEVMRGRLHPEIWALSLKNKLVNRTGKVVLTDTRFINELHMVKNLDGYEFGIYRKLPRWVPNFYRRLEVELDMGIEALDMAYASDRETLEEATRKAGKVVAPGLHESEYMHMGWLGFDQVIDNNKPLQELYKTLDLFCAQKGIPRVGNAV
jgi:hypothetical protein